MSAKEFLTFSIQVLTFCEFWFCIYIKILSAHNIIETLKFIYNALMFRIFLQLHKFQWFWICIDKLNVWHFPNLIASLLISKPIFVTQLSDFHFISWLTVDSFFFIFLYFLLSVPINTVTTISLSSSSYLFSHFYIISYTFIWNFVKNSIQLFYLQDKLVLWY